MNRFKQFVLNGILLTSVALVMRSVGVSFNIFVSNRIGAEAMGLFTLISTVYGFGMTVALSGVNLASTRLVSEAMGELSARGITQVNGKTPAVREAVKKCLFYSLFFGLLSATLLFLLAEPISERILRDSRCILPLRILALTLPPISISSALSGYFTAVRRVYKNALTQVCEQATRIFLCVILLSGSFAENVESACVCVALGGTAAEVASFIFQALMYLSEKKRNEGSKAPEGKLLRQRLLGIALPVAFSTYLRSGLITIEHILIPWGLERSGASRSRSLAAYGTLHSMVFPIIFFPSAILSSFAGLLVPEISEAKAAGRTDIISRTVNTVFETALIFSIGTAGIMSFFSFELGNMIYPATDAGKYIKMIAPLIPIMYLDTAVDAILKGLGEQVYSMGVNIVDALCSVILVLILLPKFGIAGYVITVYFTEILNAALSITRLLSVSGFKPRVTSLVIKPLLAIVASAAFVNFFGELSAISPLSESVGTIVNMALTCFVYLLLVTLMGSMRIKKIKKGWNLLKSP